MNEEGVGREAAVRWKNREHDFEDDGIFSSLFAVNFWYEDGMLCATQRSERYRPGWRRLDDETFTRTGNVRSAICYARAALSSPSAVPAAFG